MVASGRTGIDEVRTARAWLTAAAEPGSAALWEFVEAEGPVEAARRLRSGDREAPALRAAPLLAAADTHPAADAATAHLDRIHQLGGRLVIPEDREWPKTAVAPLEAATLAGQPDLAPPLALWVRGEERLDEALAQAVTVTGSRSSTPYGEHVAADLGYGLVDAGWTVISGGGFGVQAAAHRGALSAPGGGTVAVLAGGLGQPYPSAHVAMFRLVERTGLLISEWPPSAVALRRRFLLRDRLLAALGRATVVVEAGLRSAALNTARQAARVQRPVLAVPGPVWSAESTGSHVLIRDGAGLVTNTADVLAVLTARRSTADTADTT